MIVTQVPGNSTNCAWHKDYTDFGKSYKLFKDNICPILFHSLYPYFLGAVFEAKYGYNEQGDCQVGCPAEKGIDTLVKIRPYNETFGKEIPTDWRDVIHAEVVKVNGPCDYAHKVGDRFFFPTYAKNQNLCPAGLFNLFPFLAIETPSCINKKRLRCPDWKENIYYSI